MEEGIVGSEETVALPMGPPHINTRGVTELLAIAPGSPVVEDELDDLSQHEVVPVVVAPAVAPPVSDAASDASSVVPSTPVGSMAGSDAESDASSIAVDSDEEFDWSALVLQLDDCRMSFQEPTVPPLGLPFPP